MSEIKSPFPYEQTNLITEETRIVVDAKCDCGGLQSQHANSPFSWGHGHMMANGCPQFTWTGFVYADEFAQGDEYGDVEAIEELVE